MLLVAVLVARAPASMAGTLSDNIRLDSHILGYAVQYRVYTPSGGHAAALPTLYVTDGAWYLAEGDMKELLDQSIDTGKIEPLVAVFVDTRDPDDPRVNRRNEQLICKTDYARFFATELIPEIDARYGTRRDPAARTILGLSFGALNAACFGLAMPQVFRGIAMQSPASAGHLAIVADAYGKAKPLPLRMFLSVGTRDDNTSAGRKFRRVLERQGYPLAYREVPFGHEWQNWRPLLPDILATFFAPAAGGAPGP
jgi:enterochelin esterase-like enzyme